MKALSALAIAGLLCTSTAFAQQAPPAATQVASSDTASATTQYPMDPPQTAQASNPFADVPANHWAYDAVRQLAADGYIQGYPDGQFKGQRPMTRYEVAVLTDRAVRSIEAKLAQMQQVEQRDIAAVRALINAFGPELATLKSQVAALQAKQADQGKQIANLKAEADASALRLQQMKTGINLTDRPGTINQNVQIFNPSAANANCAAGAYCNTGAALSVGATGGVNSPTVGIYAHAVDFYLARLVFQGQLDPRWSYGVRIKVQGNPDTAAGTGAGTLATAYCTAVPSVGAATATTTGAAVPNCSYQDGTAKMPVYLDYAYGGYTSPGGVYAQFGRYSVGQSKWLPNPEGLLFGGQSITGATFGINDPNNKYTAAFYYGIGGTPGYLNGPSIQAADASTVTSGSPCTHPVTTTAAANTSGVVGLTVATPGSGAAVYNTAGIAGITGLCGTGTPTEIGGDANYFFSSTGTAIGFAYDSFLGIPVTYWDPAAVTCSGQAAVSAAACTAAGGAVTAATGNFFAAQGNLAAVDLNVHQNLGQHDLPQFGLDFEVARRLGSDPFAGGQWVGPNAASASITYASKGNIYNAGLPQGNALIPSTGADNSNVVQLSIGAYGQNSLGGIETGNFGGATSFQNQIGITNPDGFGIAMLQLDHWFTKNFRIGLTAIHAQLLPGVTLPVSSYAGTGGASANTCNGCFANNYSTNQIYLDNFLIF